MTEQEHMALLWVRQAQRRAAWAAGEADSPGEGYIREQLVILQGELGRALEVLRERPRQDGPTEVLVPATWRNGDPMSAGERLRIALLRLAGCRCELPLLGHVSGQADSGPRCRVCGVRVILEDTETAP